MKYFCASDLHSFYKPFKDALDEAGYDKKNKEHYLILLGDLFDRGDDTIEVYKFIKSIPKSRKILIKGNHEDLLLDLLHKHHPEYHDWHNKTVKTIVHLANDVAKKQNIDLIDFSDTTISFEGLWPKIRDLASQHEIVKWLKSKEWLDYYELDRFIFTHGFIPIVNDEIDFETETITHHDWREKEYVSFHDWEEARWSNGCKLYLAGCFDEEIKKGKVLVCGHIHAAEFHEILEKQNDSLSEEQKYNFEIYFGKNLIALDACTAYSNMCNVMVIDENFDCYQHNKKLVVKEEV